MDSQWLLNIELLFRRGQIEKAREEINLAREKSEDNSYVFLSTALLSFSNNNYEESLDIINKAINKAEADNDRIAKSFAFLSKANTLRMLDRKQDALNAANIALEIAAAEDNKLLLAKSLITKAYVYGSMGRYVESIDSAGRSLAISREIDEIISISNALLCQALSLISLSRYEDAITFLDRALELAQNTGDKHIENYALQNKAICFGNIGKYEEAKGNANQAVEIALSYHDNLDKSNAFKVLANTLRILSEYDDALMASQYSLEYAIKAEDRDCKIFALQLQVIIFSELGDIESRERILKMISDIDPSISSRIETYPIGRRLNQVLQDIMVKKYMRESNIRKIIHQDAISIENIPDDFMGEFLLLRKWASYTPLSLFRPNAITADELLKNTGGGYFLHWDNWGLVIDPGIGFCTNFRNHGFVPRNISAVVATHHHIDHTGDMLPILTCIYEINQEPLPEGITKHFIDFAFSPGPYSAFANIISYIEGIRSVQLLRNKKTIIFPISDNENVSIKAIEASHKDLTGRDDAAIGLRIEIKNKENEDNCTIGISGDTRLILSTASEFANVDLFIVHIGSIYPYDFSKGEQPWHLGYSGVILLLKEIRKKSDPSWNPLVIISEWGEELGPDRSAICKEIRIGSGISRVFPAELNQSVALKYGRADPLCCKKDKKIADHWQVLDREGSIEYLCPNHEHGRHQA